MHPTGFALGQFQIYNMWVLIEAHAMKTKTYIKPIVLQEGVHTICHCALSLSTARLLHSYVCHSMLYSYCVVKRTGTELNTINYGSTEEPPCKGHHSIGPSVSNSDLD